MSVTAEERREFLLSLPFIERLANARDCEGYKWSRMPLKAYWHPKTHKRQPQAMMEPYRCRNHAYWKFTALKKSDATSGIYCMSHLFQQFQHNREYDRYKRYADQYLERVSA